MMDNREENSVDGGASDASSDNTRRETLKRLGIFGAYTAPAIMMLLSSKASAQGPTISTGTV